MSRIQTNFNDFNHKINELRNMELNNPDLEDIGRILNLLDIALCEYEDNLRDNIENAISKMDEDEKRIDELESRVEELENEM